MKTLDIDLFIIFTALLIATVGCMLAMSTKKNKNSSFSEYANKNSELEEKIWGLRAKLDEKEKRIRKLKSYIENDGRSTKEQI